MEKRNRGRPTVDSDQVALPRQPRSVRECAGRRQHGPPSPKAISTGRLTLVRNATLLLETSLGRILVDPMLRDAGTTPPIENTPNPLPNPLVELPMPAQEVVRDVDLCIVTHLHGDHFDDAADALLPRDLPILTQPESAEPLRARGFRNVATTNRQIAMTRGRHGTGEIGAAMGPVSGWVVDGVYVARDTIWCARSPRRSPSTSRTPLS